MTSLGIIGRFLVFIYPKTDTNTMKTISPMQQPTTRLSLLVKSSAIPMYVLENGLSNAALNISIVLTLVHLLVWESFIRGRRLLNTCSSPYKLAPGFPCDEDAILALGIEEPAEFSKSPIAITHIIYRAPGVKWFSLVVLVVEFKTFPRICDNKYKK